MNFSESVIARLPKRTIPSQEYIVLARARYSQRYGTIRTERINQQEMDYVPDILAKVGFVVVRSILTETATGLARTGSLGNKRTVSALQQAWDRVRPSDAPENAAISIISNGPGEGKRFNQPGFHMIMPSEGKEVASVTQRRRTAQVTVHPGDALAWTQGESYFPCVELHNPYQNYIGSFVLHESVTYANPPVAPLPPPVSQ